MARTSLDLGRRSSGTGVTSNTLCLTQKQSFVHVWHSLSTECLIGRHKPCRPAALQIERFLKCDFCRSNLIIYLNARIRLAMIRSLLGMVLAALVIDFMVSETDSFEHTERLLRWTGTLLEPMLAPKPEVGLWINLTPFWINFAVVSFAFCRYLASSKKECLDNLPCRIGPLLLWTTHLGYAYDMDYRYMCRFVKLIRESPKLRIEGCTDVKGSQGCRDNTCSICLDNISPRQEVILHTGCSHGWHKACFSTWVGMEAKRISTCPMCRQSLRIVNDERPEDWDRPRLRMIRNRTTALSILWCLLAIFEYQQNYIKLATLPLHFALHWTVIAAFAEARYVVNDLRVCKLRSWQDSWYCFHALVCGTFVSYVWVVGIPTTCKAVILWLLISVSTGFRAVWLQEEP